MRYVRDIFDVQEAPLRQANKSWMKVHNIAAAGQCPPYTTKGKCTWQNSRCIALAALFKVAGMTHREIFEQRVARDEKTMDTERIARYAKHGQYK